MWTREKSREALRRWRRLHPERNRELRISWYRENKAAVHAINARWRARHPGYMKRYRAKHAEQSVAGAESSAPRVKPERLAPRPARVIQCARQRIPHCGFEGCKRKARTTVERLHPETRKAILVPYCGQC
jgi:hypothetical protein